MCVLWLPPWHLSVSLFIFLRCTNVDSVILKVCLSSWRDKIRQWDQWVCSLNAVPAVGPWPWGDTLHLRALQRFPEASLSPFSSPGLRRAERLWAAAVAPVRRAAACCNIGQVNNNNNNINNNSPWCCTHLHRRCRTPVAGGPGRSCTPPRAPPTATGPAARACKGCR